MEQGSHETAVGRRVFLGLAAFAATGFVFGTQIQGWLERNVGPLLVKDPTGLLSLLPIGRFRIYSVTASIPSRSRADYRLHVRGLVDRDLVLTYDEITAMPKTHLVSDFQCVTGWRVPQVPWAGVRLADVLDRAGVQSDAPRRCASSPSTAPTPRASRSPRHAGRTCWSRTSSRTRR